MSELERSEPESRPSVELYRGIDPSEEKLDLISEIKLKSEDLTQVANLLLLTSKVASEGVPGALGDEIRSGSEDLYIICEAQFKVMARELSELLSKSLV